MNTMVHPNEHDLANAAAAEIIKTLNEKPDAVICFASGNSPKLTCEQFVKMSLSNNIDTSQFFFIGLDEWVGVAPEMRGSCHYDFQERIFTPLNIPSTRIHLFDGLAVDLQLECEKMDNVIAMKGGIDLMIVGIGMNGHIGFNEPGSNFKLKSHVIALDPLTALVGQKYFDDDMILEKGITLGLEYLLQSKRVLLLANGVAKAAVVKQAVQAPVTIDFPASIMQMHSNGTIMIDEAAGSLL